MNSRTSFRFDDFLLEPHEARLTRGGEEVRLEPRALQVLTELVMRPGELVRKDELLERVWEGTFVSEAALSRAVGRVRAALSDDAAEPRFVETVPTFGYRFIAPVEAAGQTATAEATDSTTAAAPAPAAPAVPAARIGLAMLLILAVLTGSWLWGEWQSVELEPGLLAVAPFRNLEGTAEFDEAGRRATELAIRGLESTRAANIVPVTTGPDGLADDSRAALLRQVGAAAREAGAATALVGHYSRRDGVLRFYADLVDVPDSQILLAVGPVDADGPEDRVAFEALQQRVMGMVAAHFGIEMDNPLTSYIQRMVGGPEHWSRVPDYDAYVELLRGVELFARDSERARLHFLRAAELDPEFAPAWLWAESVLRTAGGEVHADILRRLDRRRDRLSAYERYRLEYAQARTRHDQAEARRWTDTILGIHPDADDIRWGAEHLSLQLNEPRRVVANLSRWEPTLWFDYGLPTGRWYFRTLTEAHHLLGDHEQELQLARRARRIYPDSAVVFGLELRALAALGRMTDIDRVVDESLALSPADGRIDQLIIEAAEELAAHGHAGRAVDLAQRAVAWLAQRGDSGPRHALALCRTGSWNAARDAYRGLAAADPGNVDWLGHLGTIAARLGSTDEAESTARRLGEPGDSRSAARRAYWRAAIHAVLGHHDAALGALREWLSTAEELDYMELHRDPHLAPLRGDPEFQEILEPKG